MYAAGPAPVMRAALGIHSTMAMKMTTISKELSTLGRMPPAMRSERKRSLLLSADDIDRSHRASTLHRTLRTLLPHRIRYHAFPGVNIAESPCIRQHNGTFRLRRCRYAR